MLVVLKMKNQTLLWTGLRSEKDLKSSIVERYTSKESLLDRQRRLQSNFVG
jgi:hypothetical protein